MTVDRLGLDLDSPEFQIQIQIRELFASYLLMPLPSALATTSIDALRAHCAAGTTVRAFQRIDEQPLRRWSLMLHS